MRFTAIIKSVSLLLFIYLSCIDLYGKDAELKNPDIHDSETPKDKVSTVTVTPQSSDDHRVVKQNKSYLKQQINPNDALKYQTDLVIQKTANAQQYQVYFNGLPSQYTTYSINGVSLQDESYIQPIYEMSLSLFNSYDQATVNTGVQYNQENSQMPIGANINYSIQPHSTLYNHRARFIESSYNSQAFMYNGNIIQTKAIAVSAQYSFNRSDGFSMSPKSKERDGYHNQNINAIAEINVSNNNKIEVFAAYGDSDVSYDNWDFADNIVQDSDSKVKRTNLFAYIKGINKSIGNLNQQILISANQSNRDYLEESEFSYGYKSLSGIAEYKATYSNSKNNLGSSVFIRDKYRYVSSNLMASRGNHYLEYGVNPYINIGGDFSLMGMIDIGHYSSNSVNYNIKALYSPLGANYSVFLSNSKRHRIPSIFEMYDGNYGNANLKVESGNVSKLGYEYNSHFIAFGVNGFYNKLNNQIAWRQSDGYYNINENYSTYGYSVYANFKLQHFYIEPKYTNTYSTKNNSPYVNKHNISLVSGLDWGRFNIEIIPSYRSGNFDNGLNDYLPNYFTVDLYSTINVYQYIDIYINAENINNNTNYIVYGYRNPGTMVAAGLSASI